jgi:energy-coupling factor transporter ATP-binding protein EcfA2
LLTDKIAALDPGPDAPPAQRLPHRVLETCFVRARKSFQAAPELGISERQLSRERARAVALLAAELASPAVAEVAPLGLPKASGSVRRDPLPRQLSEALATHRRVAVTGATGSGKTTLVSALAHALGPETAWWYRIRPGVNDTLGALLYELGHALAREGFGPLRESLARNGRQGDVGAATRLALEGLAGRRRLLVLDDFDAVRGPRAIEGFLEEVLERLPLVSVVTIGRALPGAAVLEVPPFNDSETAQLLAGLPQARGVRRPLHDLTHGHPATLGAVASWWRGEPRGLQKLERALDAREPLTNLATLTSFALRS